MGARLWAPRHDRGGEREAGREDSNVEVFECGDWRPGRRTGTQTQGGAGRKHEDEEGAGMVRGCGARATKIGAVDAGNVQTVARIVEAPSAAAQRKEPWEAGLDIIHATDCRSCCFAVAGRLPPGHMHGATHRPRFGRPGEPVSSSGDRNKKMNKC